MKLLFIVVLSLLAVSYAWEQKAELATRGRKKGNHSSWGGGGGEGEAKATFIGKFLSVLKVQERQLNLLFFDN